MDKIEGNDIGKVIAELQSKGEDVKAACKALPFEKRYSLNYILDTIDSCIKGDISLEKLREWAEVYVEILEGNAFEEKSLKEYFVDEIRTCVDMLSVYDEDQDEFYTLEEFKDVFKSLDKMLVGADSLTAFYNEDYDENQGFTLLLDDEEKEVALIYTDPDLDYNIERITRAELISKIRECQTRGYALTLIGMNADFLTEISEQN